MDCLGILFLFEIFLIVDNDLIPLVSHSHSFFLSGTFVQYSSLIESVTNIESVGLLLYTYYFYFFIIASLILLVAMIGAIVLTMHKGVYVKRQRVFEQNTREFGKTVGKIA